MSVSAGPAEIVWDMTYACPLRCVHCYSESGRRPSRQLDRAGLLRVTDAIIAMQPRGVALAGGEPLVVREVFEVAERLSAAGIVVSLYTGGWSLKPGMEDRLAEVVDEVHVSVDGATPDVHDRIRGRSGSFARAMQALSLLDAMALRRRTEGARLVRFGIDCVVVRSNFDHIERMCTGIAHRFPELGFLFFGAVAPTGLASRTAFAEDELLTEQMLRRLVDPGQVAHLQSLLPGSVDLVTTDNRELQMHPDLDPDSWALQALTVEPDGDVRAMLIYEGTVGNLLTDSPDAIWQRAVARRSDPFVTQALSSARTMAGWAEATRRIDHRFGSPEVRARLERRPAYPGGDARAERIGRAR